MRLGAPRGGGPRAEPAPSAVGGEYLAGWASLPNADKLRARFEPSLPDGIFRTLGRALLGIRTTDADARAVRTMLLSSDPDPVLKQVTAIANVSVPDVVVNMQQERWHKVSLTSANTATNARTIANLLSILANGGRFGDKQILSRETARCARD